jgi:hypothetical protein
MEPALKNWIFIFLDSLLQVCGAETDCRTRLCAGTWLESAQRVIQPRTQAAVGRISHHQSGIGRVFWFQT